MHSTNLCLFVGCLKYPRLEQVKRCPSIIVVPSGNVVVEIGEVVGGEVVEDGVVGDGVVGDGIGLFLSKIQILNLIKLQ